MFMSRLRHALSIYYQCANTPAQCVFNRPSSRLSICCRPQSLCYPCTIVFGSFNIASVLHPSANESGVAVLSMCCRPDRYAIHMLSSPPLSISPPHSTHLLTRAASRCYQDAAGHRSPTHMLVAGSLNIAFLLHSSVNESSIAVLSIYCRLPIAMSSFHQSCCINKPSFSSAHPAYAINMLSIGYGSPAISYQ